MLSSTQFPIRHTTAYLYLGAPGSTWALCFSAILNSEITYQKYKKYKMVPLKRVQKGHEFTCLLYTSDAADEVY